MTDDEEGEDFQENWSNDELSDSEAPEDEGRSTRTRKSPRGSIRPAMSRVSAQVSRSNTFIICHECGLDHVSAYYVNSMKFPLSFQVISYLY